MKPQRLKVNKQSNHQTDRSLQIKKIRGPLQVPTCSQSTSSLKQLSDFTISKFKQENGFQIERKVLFNFKLVICELKD